MHVETLPSPTPPDYPQIVELGHVVLHHGRVVPQLPTEVLVVAGPEGHHGTVGDLAEGDNLEGRGESLVAPPVSWKSRTEDVWSSSLDQFPRVLGQDLTDLSLRPPPLARVHRVGLLLSLALAGGSGHHRSHVEIISWTNK